MAKKIEVNYKIGADTQGAVKAVDRLQTEISGVSKGAKNATNDWQKFTAEVNKSARAASGIKPPQGGGFGKDQIGDLSTTAGAFASVASELDKGSQAALAFAGDVAGAIEYIPAMGKAVSGLVTSLNPATAALAIVALGVTAFVASIINSQQELNAAISASIQANADIERKIGEGLTAEQAQAEIDRLTKAREAELEIIRKEKESREQASSAAQAQFGILSGAVLGFVNATSEAEQKSADVQAEAQKNASAFQAEINRLNQAVSEGELAANDAAEAEKALAIEREHSASITADAIRSVSSALASGLDTEGLTKRIAETKAALDAELEIRRRLTAAGEQNTAAYTASEQRTQTLNATLSELETTTTKAGAAANTAAKEQDNLGTKTTTVADAAKQAADAMALFQARAEDIAASRALSDARAAEDEATREQRAQEDLARALEQQEKAHQNRMADIVAKGQAAIQQAQQELIQKQIEAAEQIALLQAQFADESLRAQQQFEKERLRRQRDFETARQRLEEDFQIDRFDAILSGDISGSLRAERDFKLSKRRNKQDFATSEGDLSDDFAQEQAERAAALATKIAEIQAELAEYTAATQAKIAAIQAQTAAELQAEQQVYDEKLALDAELRAIQKQRDIEDSEIKRARLIEDRQIEDTKAQEALNLRLSQIQQESSAQSTAHQTAVSGINAVTNAAQRLIAIAQNAARAASGGLPLQPFAEGGIVPGGGSPLLGLFERRQTEAVIPLDSSAGQRLLSGMGGGSPQFHIEVHVDGANGSPEDIGNAVSNKLKETMPGLFEEYTRRLMRGASQT